MGRLIYTPGPDIKFRTGVIGKVTDEPEKTVSGAIASFDDGADNKPLHALFVGIEPVQDLHGYDAPWPAGGGKNLLDPSNILGTDAVFSDDGDLFTVIDSTGGTRIIYKHLFKANTTYTISATMVSGTHKPCIIVRNSDGSSTGQVTNYANNANPVTFTFTEDCDWNVILQTMSASDRVVNGEKFKIQIELGSSATSFVPYSNVCPITGWDEVTVMRTGKNLCASSYSGDETRRYMSVFWAEFDIRPLTTYVVSFVGTSGNSLYVNEKIANWKSFSVQDGITTVTIETKSILSKSDPTQYENDKGWTLFKNNQGQSAVNFFTNVQIEPGSTASAYEPYQGTSVTVDLDGTRYGAQLNVLTGELTVDRKLITPTSLSSSAYSTANLYWPWLNNSGFDLPNDKSSSICNMLPMTTDLEYFKSHVCMISRSSGLAFNPYGTGYATVEEANTAGNAFLQNGDVQFVVPLAEPVTYNLSPETLSTLLGENHIWADTGDVEVTYPVSVRIPVIIPGVNDQEEEEADENDQ